jgi:trigger factor
MAEVARGKALALVVEKAEVVDTSGRPVDLDRLREDGTLGAPGTDEVLPSGIEFAELDESAESVEDSEPADEEDDETARS